MYLFIIFIYLFISLFCSLPSLFLPLPSLFLPRFTFLPFYLSPLKSSLPPVSFLAPFNWPFKFISFHLQTSFPASPQTFPLSYLSYSEWNRHPHPVKRYINSISLSLLFRLSVSTPSSCISHPFSCYPPPSRSLLTKNYHRAPSVNVSLLRFLSSLLQQLHSATRSHIFLPPCPLLTSFALTPPPTHTLAHHKTIIRVNRNSLLR